MAADGQCRGAGPEEARGQAVREPEAQETVEQPGDADGLPVRVRRSVEGHADAVRDEVPGARVADGVEGHPGDRRADRPGRLRVARLRRRLQPLAADADERVVVGQVHVVVVDDRPEEREVEEAVALETRAEALLCGEAGDEEHGEHEGDGPRGGRFAAAPEPAKAQQGSRGGESQHRARRRGRRAGQVVQDRLANDLPAANLGGVGQEAGGGEPGGPRGEQAAESCVGRHVF